MKKVGIRVWLPSLFILTLDSVAKIDKFPTFETTISESQPWASRTEHPLDELIKLTLLSKAVERSFVDVQTILGSSIALNCKLALIYAKTWHKIYSHIDLSSEKYLAS